MSKSRKHEVYAKTQAEISAAWGVPLATIRLWVSRGMPGKKNRWPLVAGAKWAFGQRVAVSDQMTALKLRREAAAAKAHEARADLTRMQVDEAAGKLIATAAHESVVRDIALVFVNVFERAPADLANRPEAFIQAWAEECRLQLGEHGRLMRPIVVDGVACATGGDGPGERPAADDDIETETPIAAECAAESE